MTAQLMDYNSDLGRVTKRERGADEMMKKRNYKENENCGKKEREEKKKRDEEESAEKQGVDIGEHKGYKELLGYGRRAKDD